MGIASGNAPPHVISPHTPIAEAARTSPQIMENDNTDPLPALAGFPVMPAEPSPSVAPMPIAQQPAPTMEQQDTTMMDAAVRCANLRVLGTLRHLLNTTAFSNTSADRNSLHAASSQDLNPSPQHQRRAGGRTCAYAFKSRTSWCACKALSERESDGCAAGGYEKASCGTVCAQLRHKEISRHETNGILWAGQKIPYKYLVNIYCIEVKT